MRIPAFMYRFLAALLGILRIGAARASLDFASLSAGLQAALTITVTGAKVGDYVLWGVSAALDTGISITAYVSAADTVTLIAVNNTAGAVDPVAATYNVTVLRRLA